MTYGEHMRWCKDRALAELDRGDVVGALASMASDVKKHDETNTPTVTMLLATEGMRLAIAGDVARLRDFIEGFASA